MAKRESWWAQFKAAEERFTVSVIDAADKGALCATCGEKRMVFFAHCFREENLKTAPGPGLRKRWDANQRVAACSEAQLEAGRRGREAMAAERAGFSEGEGERWNRKRL